jgi:hypothetical protein
VKKYFILFWLAAISNPLFNLWQGMTIPTSPAIAPPSLTKPPATENKDARAQILGHNLWDKQRGQMSESKHETLKGAESASAPVDTNWQLKGILMPNAAYLKTGKKLKPYHPPQKLPDGAILRKILIDGIVLEKNTKKYNVYLFGKKP